MHSITTSAHSMTVEIPPSGKVTREVFAGSELEISASPNISLVTLLDAPGGIVPTIDGTTITFPEDEPGRFLLRVDFADGKSAHLHVMSMERACLERVPVFPPHIIVNPQADPKPVGRTLTERILTLRSLSNHEQAFNGTADSILKLRLANHGG
ncbi:MAG TPA: hypothetical protein VK745_25575 [Polyangiaceae bacterium]|jgi:hypothetical protein|nr:hypothetical protein [Polyangiaceae bacterium]